MPTYTARVLVSGTVEVEITAEDNYKALAQIDKLLLHKEHMVRITHVSNEHMPVIDEGGEGEAPDQPAMVDSPVEQVAPGVVVPRRAPAIAANSPEAAMAEAAKRFKKGAAPEKPGLDDEIARIGVPEMRLPPTVTTALMEANIYTVGDLAGKTRSDLLGIKGIGYTTLDRICRSAAAYEVEIK